MRPCLLALLWSGCGLFNPSLEKDLSGLLRDYIIAQELYFVQHDHYAPTADSLTRGLAVPPWMQIRVHESGGAGHSAHAWSIRNPNLVCVVFAGPVPAALDRGFPGDPMCGTPAQFGPFMGGREPVPSVEGGPPGPPSPSPVSVTLIVLLVLGATYGLGLGLDRASRRFPRIWNVVFWTPATLVTLFIALSAGLGAILRGAGGYQWGFAVFGLAIAAGLNLGLFSVPHALRRARSADWWASLVLLAVAAVVYGTLAYRVSGDVAGSRRFGMGTNADTLTIAFVTTALALLNVIAIVQLIRARRRAQSGTPAAAAGAAEAPTAHRPDAAPIAVTNPRRTALLLTALAVSALFFVLDRGNTPTDEPEPGRAETFLASYVQLQEAYFVDHGRYATADDRRAIPVPIGVTLRIISSSVTGHSAIAYSDSTQQLCAVWVGEPVPLLDHDRQAIPVCDAPPRFEPWLVSATRATVARRTEPAAAGGADTPGGPVEAGPDDVYRGIFAGEQWQTGRAFLDWATVVPLVNEVTHPCPDAARARLADSIDDVRFCESLATVGPDREPSGQLVWAIVRTAAVPRYDCWAGIAYLGVNRLVLEPSPADCEYVLAIEDPSDTPILAFRVRETGEIGLVVDAHGAECAGRFALVADGDRFRTVHTFYHECAR